MNTYSLVSPPKHVGHFGKNVFKKTFPSVIMFLRFHLGPRGLDALLGGGQLVMDWWLGVIAAKYLCHYFINQMKRIYFSDCGILWGRLCGTKMPIFWATSHTSFQPCLWRGYFKAKRGLCLFGSKPEALSRLGRNIKNHIYQIWGFEMAEMYSDNIYLELCHGFLKMSRVFLPARLVWCFHSFTQRTINNRAPLLLEVWPHCV